MNKCVVCEKEFCLVNNKGRKKRLTCSKDCLTIHKKQNAKKNRKLVVCKTCSKEEELPEAFAKTYSYCSYDCRNKGLSIRYKNRVLTEQWIEKQNASKIKEKIVKYGIFNCEKCQKQFNTNTSLRAHKAKCSNKKWGNYICNKCNKHFNNPPAMYFDAEPVQLSAAPLDPRFDDLVAKCARFLNLGENWNSYRSRTIEQNLVEEGLRLAAMVLMPGRRAPSIVPTALGGVQLEWHSADEDLEIEVRALGRYRVYHRKGVEENEFEYYTDKALEAGYDIVRVWDSEQSKFIKELLSGSQNNENSFNHKR